MFSKPVNKVCRSGLVDCVACLLGGRRELVTSRLVGFGFGGTCQEFADLLDCLGLHKFKTIRRLVFPKVLCNELE